MMDHKKRVNVMHGLEVDIVLKKNQKGGELTRGYVEKILTYSPRHLHEIIVMLSGVLIFCDF